MNIKESLTDNFLSSVVNVRGTRIAENTQSEESSEIPFFVVLHAPELIIDIPKELYVKYPVTNELQMAVCFTDEGNTDIRILEKLRERLEHENVFLGTIHEGFEGIYVSFYEAYETFYVNKYYQPANKFELISKFDTEVNKPHKLIRIEWQIHNSMAYKGGQDVIPYIRQWFSACREENFTVLDIKCNLVMLYANIKDVIFDFYVLKHQKIKIGIEVFEIVTITTSEELEQWFLVWINYTLTNFMPKQKNRKLIFSDVMVFMEKHILENMSLDILSEHFLVSPSYMSRYFVKKTGRTFSSYQTELKMKKAFELLSGNHKVYEVAQMIGYSDVQYFRNLFKKQFRMVPGAVCTKATGKHFRIERP